VGRELAEIKIYTLRSRGGYRSFQCCWYELGKRQAKTFTLAFSGSPFALVSSS
jgi:hypothetical protein